MEKKTKIERITIGVCLAILIFFAATIVIRFLTRQVLIDHFGMENAFTKLIFFDDEDSTTASTIVIDWKALYPFDSSDSNIEQLAEESEQGNFSEPRNTIFTKYTEVLLSIEYIIDLYSTQKLIWYNNIVEAANAYENFIGWNFAPFEEYNPIIELSDGYLSSYIAKRDTTQQFNALSEFNDYCTNNDIDFLYVQAPYKISQYDDEDISGKLDFSNQNANDLLSKLDAANIDYYDIRETIYKSGLSNRKLFYKTDHHWLTTTGLWASQNILKYCNERYGWNADLSRLDENQFEYITYKNWFLGSEGKKVTLSRTTPDDFILLYPKYETSFHYYVPQEGINTISDYSIVYDMQEVENNDYYSQNAYGACNYGDQPLIEIENQLEADEHRILFIHDSFGDCVVSCLALAEKNIDSLDLGHFTGSVRSYVEETKPDLVIVMFNAGIAGKDVDYSTHGDRFDFR